MKKLLAAILLLVILGGTAESKAFASADEMPKLRTFSVPIDNVQLLK
ncbi:hypothetical protein [Sporosarcina sp. FA9]